MSLVSSMNIAQQALSVSQAAITTVSNNIANVDTPGYSKLRVNQSTVVNYTPSLSNAQQVAESASGVKIEQVQRYADSYLQNYYWQESSKSSYLDQYASVATNVQDVVNELNTGGLSDALESFYSAVTELNNNPTDITSRENYVNAASNLCTIFNSTSKSLSDIRTSYVGNSTPDGSLESSEISSQLDTANGLLDQIAQVNYDIIKTGSSSPALLDQRDSLISKLSSLMPASVTENKNGTVNISLGDTNLVAGSSVKGYLSASATGDPAEPVKISIVDSENPATVIAGNVNDIIDDGSMGALLDICGSDDANFTISGVLGSLDTMASEFADIMNTIQTGDPNADGTVAMALDSTGTSLVATAPTDVLFKINNATDLTITAANICVSQDIIDHPYGIAVARVAAADVGTTNAIGNNSNMNLVLGTREKSYPGMGNTTIENYLGNVVSKVGSDVADINSSLKTQNLVLNEVSTKLSSATGVNLDEELTDLIKYQRAYQAASRVFTICNDLMGELVNLGK